MGETPQYMEGDPLVNAEMLLEGVLAWVEHSRSSALRRGHLADLEVALAEVRRASSQSEPK